jgi:hypothetical protein
MHHMTQQPILESRPDHGSGRLVSGSGRVGFRFLCVIFGFFLIRVKILAHALPVERSSQVGSGRVFFGRVGSCDHNQVHLNLVIDLDHHFCKFALFCFTLTFFHCLSKSAF